MEELLKGSEIDNLKEGSVIKGIITEIRPTEVVVDIGGKSEGVVHINEFVDPSELEVNSEIEVYLEKLENKEGYPVISFDKAEQKKNWEKIADTCEEGSIVQGRVRSIVKGGLIVSIGVDSFLPTSQIDVQAPKNLEQYVGQTYDFKVVKINPERKNIVVSRRELVEEQRIEKRRALLDDVKPGDRQRGQVKNITDYGAFVDLDGLDGLLHITDMSWGRIQHPSEMLKQGEEIEVVIIEIDRDRERVSLGLKQLHPNPWEKIDDKYPLGAKVTGRVVNLVPYGVFIELEEGVEGLVHVTELSWTKRITKPSDVMKIGEEVSAVVLGIQKDEQKISLGIRQLEENPWEAAKINYPLGMLIEGEVRNLTTYGAFIELEDGIAIKDKDQARKNTIEALKTLEIKNDVELVVRINCQRTKFGLLDLEAFISSKIKINVENQNSLSQKISTNEKNLIKINRDREAKQNEITIIQTNISNNKNLEKNLREIIFQKTWNFTYLMTSEWAERQISTQLMEQTQRAPGKNTI